MRIAVVYFGIVREKMKSLSSIRSRIIEPNTVPGISLVSFASLNIVDSLQNPRSNEINISLNKSDIFELDAGYYILSKQEDDQIEDELSLAKSRGDVYSDNCRSIRNLLHQMASLQRAWRWIQASASGYFDAYLFARADLCFLDQVDLRALCQNLSSERSILVPAWHSWGGLNDRVALAAPEAAECYALRFSSVLSYCRNHALHAETYLAWALAQQNCVVGELPIRASRVRGNGHVNDENFADARLPLPRQPVSFNFSPGRPLTLNI